MSDKHFKVGRKFETFEELESMLKEYKQVSYANFYKAKARTIKNASQRLTKQIKPELKYDAIMYKCIYGKKHKLSSENSERTRQTLNTNCMAKISLRVCA